MGVEEKYLQIYDVTTWKTMKMRR